MNSHTVRFIRRGIRAVAYGAIGAVLVLIAVLVVYLNSRADLEIWHLAELDEEFRADSGVGTFSDYLVLEERLFGQLEERVYATVPAEQRHSINRYSRGSLSETIRHLAPCPSSLDGPVGAASGRDAQHGVSSARIAARGRSHGPGVPLTTAPSRGPVRARSRCAVACP